MVTRAQRRTRSKRKGKPFLVYEAFNARLAPTMRATIGGLAPEPRRVVMTSLAATQSLSRPPNNSKRSMAGDLFHRSELDDS